MPCHAWDAPPVWHRINAPIHSTHQTHVMRWGGFCPCRSPLAAECEQIAVVVCLADHPNGVLCRVANAACMQGRAAVGRLCAYGIPCNGAIGHALTYCEPLLAHGMQLARTAPCQNGWTSKSPQLQRDRMPLHVCHRRMAGVVRTAASLSYVNQIHGTGPMVWGDH